MRLYLKCFIVLYIVENKLHIILAYKPICYTWIWVVSFVLRDLLFILHPTTKSRSVVGILA
jgi:hypothetical protein